MNENFPPYRAGVLLLTRASLTTGVSCELRMLFDQLDYSSFAAAGALGKAGPTPTGLDLQRFKDLGARVVVVADRIKALLGR